MSKLSPKDKKIYDQVIQIRAAQYPGRSFFKINCQEISLSWEIFVNFLTDEERGRIILQLQTWNRSQLLHKKYMPFLIRLLEEMKEQIRKQEMRYQSISKSKKSVIQNNLHLKEYQLQQKTNNYIQMNLAYPDLIYKPKKCLQQFVNQNGQLGLIIIIKYLPREIYGIIQYQQRHCQKMEHKKFKNLKRLIESHHQDLNNIKCIKLESKIFQADDATEQFYRDFKTAKFTVRELIKVHKVLPEIGKCFRQIEIVAIILQLYGLEKQDRSPMEQRERIEAVKYFQSFRFGKRCKCQQCLRSRRLDLQAFREGKICEWINLKDKNGQKDAEKEESLFSFYQKEEKKREEESHKELKCEPNVKPAKEKSKIEDSKEKSCIRRLIALIGNSKGHKDSRQ